MQEARTRQQLAQEGTQQVQELMRTCQSMVEAYGTAARAVESTSVQRVASAGAGGGAGAKPDQPGTSQPPELLPERLAQQLKGLQQQYTDAAAAARRTLQQCRELEQRDASAMATRSAPTAQEEKAGRARCDALRCAVSERSWPQSLHCTWRLGAHMPPPPRPRGHPPHIPMCTRRERLEERNQLVKMLIDRLRLLLDALTMWEAHAAQLAAAS